MFSAKMYSLASASVAAAMLVLGTSPGYSATSDRIVLAQQAEPADSAPAEQHLSANEETAQAPDAGAAADGQTAPVPEGGDTAAPAAEPEAPAAPADATDAPAPDNGAAAAPEGAAPEAAPAAPEAPAAETEPSAPEPSAAASSTIEASQLKIGQAVLGSDGAKIGEINGVKSDTSGKVQEILVTAGTPAGINAQVYAISGDKITEVADGVKLSISSEEAKQLPIVDKSNG